MKRLGLVALLVPTALFAAPADCVPMRWMTDDPASLQLLRGSPVNCLLLEPSQWTLRKAIQERSLQAIAVARNEEEAAAARRQPFDAIVLEGDFDSPGTRFAIRLTPRRALRFDLRLPVGVMGTTEGVWPGVLIEHAGPKEKDEQHAGPTGGVWIHTNTGFLRYVRAAMPAGAVFWMANRPPEGEEFDAQRYVQVIADAATVGARWVVSLDATFAKRVLSGDAAADWQRIQDALRFYEEHKEWRAWQPYAQLALVQDRASGALVTGNLLDMLAVMNTPVKAVPSRELSEARLEGARVTVALHADSYTEEQQALIRKFAASGGKVVTGPEGFRMPEAKDGRITFSKADYEQLEQIWPELHVAVQRKNFGVRMFNVSGTLSYLLKSADGGKALLHLVNYTGYPVENLTAFVQGKYKRASLLVPGVREPKKLEVYDSEEGTGVDIDQMGAAAAVLLEQ